MQKWWIDLGNHDSGLHLSLLSTFSNFSFVFFPLLLSVFLLDLQLLIFPKLRSVFLDLLFCRGWVSNFLLWFGFFLPQSDSKAFIWFEDECCSSLDLQFGYQFFQKKLWENGEKPKKAVTCPDPIFRLSAFSWFGASGFTFLSVFFCSFSFSHFHDWKFENFQAFFFIFYPFCRGKLNKSNKKIKLKIIVWLFISEPFEYSNERFNILNKKR